MWSSLAGQIDVLAHGYTARWYRHGGPPEWPALTTSVVRADRDEVIHFDFGGEEISSATSVYRDVRIYPGEAVDGALAFLVRELASAGWLDGLVGRERRGLPPDQRTGEAIEEAIVAAGCKIKDATALVDRLLHPEVACRGWHASRRLGASWTSGSEPPLRSSPLA